MANYIEKRNTDERKIFSMLAPDAPGLRPGVDVILNGVNLLGGTVIIYVEILKIPRKKGKNI